MAEKEGFRYAPVVTSTHSSRMAIRSNSLCYCHSFVLPASATGSGRTRPPRASVARLQIRLTKKEKDYKSSPFSWRRRRDLNPRAGHPTYTLSRGASSPLEYFSMVNLKLSWRRERDSNPWLLAESLVFKTSSLNHSDISPYLCGHILNISHK